MTTALEQLTARLRAELGPASVITDAATLRAYECDGLTAYRQGFGRSKARAGKQPENLAESQLWVVPNPSGLNAHDTISSLAQAYAEPARAAGILTH